MKTADKRYSASVGQRVAALRRERGINQTRLGEMVGVTQQNIAAYETAKLRIPLNLIEPLARALDVTVPELLDLDYRCQKPGPQSLLEKQITRLRQMPSQKQRLASQLLETFIENA